MKQRRRWYRGMYQVLDKHRNLYLSIKHGVFGVFGVPNLWFDAISPFFNTALILLTLVTVFLGDPSLSLFGITLYFVIQFAIGIFAVSLDPQPRLRDFLGIPLLLFHNVFLDGVRLMSFTEETINVFMKWEKPKR
jgi:cellulose synthase/poly-beta-1,6-N-acetylglucosamine synthase-like glycosyltransferase